MAMPMRTGTNPVHVEADPRTLLRLRRMSRELRLTDQILSFDLDSLVLVDKGRNGNAPAWTTADGSTITIDVGRMPNLNTRKGIAVWLGTNFHELLHNLFTPRSGSRLMRRVAAAERSTSAGIHRSWNILEDQRIERLGLHRYAACRGYLIAALAHHIPVAHEGAWVLVAGRTWLSDEVRAIARATFVATNGDQAARRAAELIGAYQALFDPGEDDADEAWAILTEFHELFGSQAPRRGGCGNQPVTEGEPEDGDDGTVSDSFPTADEADEDDEDEGDDDDGEGESDPDEDEGDESEDIDGDDEGDEGDGDSDEDGDDDGEGESDEDESGTDDDDDFGSDGDGEGEDEDDESGDDPDDGDDDGEGGGSGHGESGDNDPGDGVGESDGTRRTIEDAIDDAIDEALDDDETKSDLDRVIDQVDHGSAGPGDLSRSSGEWHDVTDVARGLAREVSEVLAEIRDDNEAAWIRRTDTGRFNVGRWATDPNWDADDVFDEFQAGAMDASSLDCVLVLDVSGSMSSDIFTLGEATWAIRTAIDKVEGECTVVGFGDVGTMIFDRGSRPDGRIFVPHLEGSTNPTQACREAHRIVAESQAANRIVIVLTDGDWWPWAEGEDALRAAKAAGAVTAVIGLGSYGRRYVSPGMAGADVVEHITTADELVPIFRDIAERSMRAAAHQYGR